MSIKIEKIYGKLLNKFRFVPHGKTHEWQRIRIPTFRSTLIHAFSLYTRAYVSMHDRAKKKKKNILNNIFSFFLFFFFYRRNNIPFLLPSSSLSPFLPPPPRTNAFTGISKLTWIAG